MARDEPTRHPHAHGLLELPQSQGKRVRILLAAIVLPILAITVAGLIWFWPGEVAAIGSMGDPTDDDSYMSGVVTEVTGEQGQEARVALDDDGTEVPVQVPPEVIDGGLAVGDHILMFRTADALGTGSPYVYSDAERDRPMLILFALYVLVVLLVARLKGLAALAGLGASMGVVLLFLVPALMAGSPPLPVTLIGASGMMFFAVYLAHGVSIRTTTALLGTFVGLAFTTVLAAWSSQAAGLVGYGSDTSSMVSAMLPGVGLRDVLLAGMVIAGLGALNDVTITQASAVWEIHAANPQARTREVFKGAMRIGRDHIASTVYTLAFAYVGTALALLMIVMMFDRSLADTLTTSEIAEEIVRTLVASIGLVIAIPATTALAALLVKAAPAPRWSRGAATEVSGGRTPRSRHETDPDDIARDHTEILRTESQRTESLGTESLGTDHSPTHPHHIEVGAGERPDHLLRRRDARGQDKATEAGEQG